MLSQVEARFATIEARKLALEKALGTALEKYSDRLVVLTERFETLRATLNSNHEVRVGWEKEAERVFAELHEQTAKLDQGLERVEKAG